MHTEKEYQIMRRAAFYELRILLTTGDKKEYTVEEITELIDKIAMAKYQE